MTHEEILKALAKGQKVHWSNVGYEVIIDKFDRLMVVFTSNQYCTFLTDGEMKDCFLGANHATL